jgi:multiple sugar transport system permease protein
MTAGASAPVRKRAGAQQRREWLWAFVFISPWIIGFVVFTAGPMIASLLLSFTNFDNVPQTPDKVVGLLNYQNMMTDKNVGLALANTLYFAVLFVPTSMIFALFLATLLNRVGGRPAGFFRTAFYLPSITPAVAVGTFFLLILNGQNGLLNQFLGILGVPGPSWTSDPSWVKIAIVIMMLWSVGGTVVIYFAALRNVPVEMYEAAKIDGANAWQQFRSITVPFISGALFFTLIINTIAALQMFEQVYTMFFGQQRTSAGSTSALFYVVYVFQEAFQFFKMGYAAALSWVLFVVIAIITVIQVRVGGRLVYYGGDDR